MMIAASYSLVQEAIEFASDDFGILSYFYESYHIFQPYRHSLVRTGCGFVIGIVFILLMKKVLDRYEGMELMDMSGASAQRMFLIVIVMTLHSLTEGIGLGVSFGGKTGVKLGKFITFSLAFHNVPEGLAVGLVMTGKKISPLRSSKSSLSLTRCSTSNSLSLFQHFGQYLQVYLNHYLLFQHISLLRNLLHYFLAD